MARTASVEHSHIGPRDVRRLEKFPADQYRELRKLGIDITDRALHSMVEGIGMDALTVGLTVGSIPTPVQFLQNWLPGFVSIVTAPRKIDDFIGLTTSGAWEDEEVVQGLKEQLGTSVPYGDYTNVPLSSWNANFATRTVVRFEEGMQVGLLEEARASRMKINSAAEKREAATLALEIQRNAVGFYGYNGGDNLTYGFLNDPGLPAYVEFPQTGTSGSPNWSQKTFQQVTADIRLAFATLRTNSQDLIDPKAVQITMGLATSTVDNLSITTDYGMSVQDWLDKTYPNTRVISAPELNAANAGMNVFYLYAEKVSDGSTDDGRTFAQIVPAKFRTLGVEQKAKAYVEDYSNATAGVLLKRPFAVARFYGN